MGRKWGWLVLLLLLAACQQPESAQSYPPVSATSPAVTFTAVPGGSSVPPTRMPEGPVSPTPPGSSVIAPTVGPVSSKPVPSPTTISFAENCYDQPCTIELISPDQQRRWPLICRSLGLDVECEIQFSNGQKSTRYRWPLKWSSTSAYLLVPVGGSHDTPVSGYELWNMATETREKVFDVAFSGYAEWAPDGQRVFYLSRSSGSDPGRLMKIDLAAGGESSTRECPDFLLGQIRTADDYRFWLSYCDNVPVLSNAPTILSFTVEPDTASPGDMVTVQWSTSGGVTASLQQNVNGNFAEPVEVALNGSTQVTLGTDQRGWVDFHLELTGNDQRSDMKTAWLGIICPDAFFFTSAPPPASAGCPYRPAARIQAAEQVFEHGRMIWIDAIPAESSRTGSAEPSRIYVFYDPGVVDAWGVWQFYADTWVEGEPETDPALVPPEGRFQPIRGFGKVWRVTPEVRNRLGWAVATETGYRADYQWGSDYYFQAGSLFLKAASGKVLKLDENQGLHSYWSIWTP